MLAAERRRRLRFPLEASGVVLPHALLRRGQDLDGDDLIDREVSRLHDDAEATSTELPLDAVFPGDHATWLHGLQRPPDHDGGRGDLRRRRARMGRGSRRASHGGPPMLPFSSMARSAKRRRRRNLDAPESIEDLLDRAGEDRFAKRRPPIPMREWKVIVGPRIADRAHPITLERGILLVKVTTSVWANELSDARSGARRAAARARPRGRSAPLPRRSARPARSAAGAPHDARGPRPCRSRPRALGDDRQDRRPRSPRRHRARREREPRLAGLRRRPRARAPEIATGRGGLARGSGQRSAARRSSPSRRWKRKRSAGP